MHIMNIVGARPNFVKIAPLVGEIAQRSDLRQTLVHTGQHYDAEMSQIFFDELNIPKPDFHLGIGSASHAVQTARIMMAFEEVLLQQQPDVVVVVGDVNSTLACTLTATKLHIPVAHIEAGVRSFDRRMPEEVNRVLTDAVADMLFTTSPEANENLHKEGIPEEKIFLVGNIMIDTLQQSRQRAKALGMPAKFNVTPHQYALLTLHRASNVDDQDTLQGILDALLFTQEQLPILFPAHPRTLKQLHKFGLYQQVEQAPQLHIIPPQSYLAFLDLMMHAQFVLTDSGGIQEETSVLGVPCLTLRENTEWTITLTAGTNQLVGVNPIAIKQAVTNILNGRQSQKGAFELWDGHTARRIVDVLIKELA